MDLLLNYSDYKIGKIKAHVMEATFCLVFIKEGSKKEEARTNESYKK
ncbi:MAG: hypothetical protein ACI9N3_001555 [Colwellia sp.]|jgi:hypothetical protein